jgi:hypothetical protein
MNRRTFLRLSAAALVEAAALTGCKRRSDDKKDDTVSVGGEDADCLVLIAVDLSGSFAVPMAEQGKAHEFVLRVADTYFRNSIGTNNRIVISQLSGVDRPLLWDGTPVQLRRDFPSAAEFRDFLLKKSNPGGSRIFDGVSDVLDYAVSDPGVRKGKTRAAVFVLSDFIDNLSGKDSENRLAQSLQAFGKTGGIVGFYFLDHAQVPTWRGHLSRSGIRQWVCESEIVAYPQLPTFE